MSVHEGVDMLGKTEETDSSFTLNDNHNRIFLGRGFQHPGILLKGDHASLVLRRHRVGERRRRRGNLF